METSMDASVCWECFVGRRKKKNESVVRGVSGAREGGGCHVL